MPPRKKTGVQNVDIGGAYRLERDNSKQASPAAAAHLQVEHPQEDVDAELDAPEQEEDVDAELEALAQAEEDNAEGTATEDTTEAAAASEASQGNSAPDAADKTESDNGDDVTEPETTAEDMDTAESMKPEGHAELDTGDDVDAELQALAEEIEGDCDNAVEDANMGISSEKSQAHHGQEEGEAAPGNYMTASTIAAETEAEDGAEDMDDGKRSAALVHHEQADDVRESAGDIGHATNPTTSLPAQPDSRQSPSVHAGANALKATAKEASIIAPSPASSTPDGQAPKKDGGDASKPVIKAKKRQLAPVPQKPSTATPAGPPSKQAPVNGKFATGSRAGAMMKAVASAATSAAAKLKGTAPSNGTKAAKGNKPAEGGSAANQGASLKAAPKGAAPKTAAAPAPAAGKPAVAGKKLVAAAARTSATPAVAALGTPAKDVLQKTGPATNGQNSKAEEGKPQGKGKGKGGGSEAEKAPKAPRAKNAYMFFTADKRDAVKGETPGISIGDIAKTIGEMWRGLSAADKKPYQDMADADKDRVAKLKADMPSVPKQTKAAKEAKADKTPRAKSAYLLFCDVKRSEIKAANPGAGFGETGKLLAAAWKECSPEDKANFQEQSQSAKMELQASAALQTLASVKKQKQGKAVKAAAVTEEEAEEEEEQMEEAAAEEGSAVSGGTAEAEVAAEAGTGVEPVDGEDAARGGEATAAMLADEESDDEADRERADWDANPAEMIIGHTYHNKYMVKRKGLDFTEYGLVDARAAKRQRLTGDSNDPKVPVSLEMVEEYDSFCKQFRKAVHENQDQGNLDLDNIGQGSPLEMCYYLGKLQEENYLLSKPPKRKGEVDVMIKVPMLGVSMVVQRLVNAERTLRIQAEGLVAEKTEENERLKGELTVLQMMATAAQDKITTMEE